MKKIKLTKEQVQRLSNYLNESDIVKGGLDRVNKGFNKELRKNGVKLSEEMNNSLELLKHFSELVYSNPQDKEFARFIKQNNVKWSDMVKYLTNVGILGVSDGGVYRISNIFKKPYKSNEEKLADLPNIANKAIEIIKQNPTALVKNKQEVSEVAPNAESNYPEGTENNPSSPWNEKDCQTDFPSDDDMFKGIHMNREVAILNSNSGTFMFDYADIPREQLPNPNCELDVEDIAMFVSRNYKNKSLIKFGNSLADYLNGNIDLIKLDEDVKNWLRKTYSKDKKLMAVIDKLMETTTAASSGAFTGPLGGNTNNRCCKPAKELKIVNNEDEFLGGKYDTLHEMTAANSPTGDPSSTTTGQYVQPRIWAKNEKNWAGNKRTQYPDGEMVKFDSCTKLNNNKKAQNGGCSQGDSNVVKTYKTKDSVISKNKSIYEEVAAKTGKTVEEVKNIIESRLKNNLTKN